MSANQGISGASAATLDKDPADQSAVSHCAETALENTDAQTALTSESLPQRLSITARLNAIKLSEKVKLRAKIAVSVVRFYSARSIYPSLSMSPSRPTPGIYSWP